ncbi:hypothetical protein KC19_8G082500 [Ceratodon purpureus]|uniref:Uncharacterized protein n=1 Tax=Ceratodon purpureus TaxID=3225 RepID=A0A8T0H122_CERPU|nr:hypothetical protein KC19_8G082500 [Ceratodon purpureus]KAG0564099.1 hypothetical protein KC19_8G082500 [Ceratodon purpureus]
MVIIKEEDPPASPWTDDSGPDILEILNDPEAKKLLTPERLGILLTKCPIYQLEEAWKHIGSPAKFPPTPTEISKNQWLRQWKPVTFKDAAKRLYQRYHPCLLETSTKLYYVIGFDSTTNLKKLGIHNWIALPPLNYLPQGCEKVIAGAAGLLVVEGGEQPGSKPIILWGQLAIPNEKFWNNEKVRKQCGGQSIVCVTNPITREYIILPPIPKRRLNSKIAKFVFTDLQRSKYHLVISGWDTQRRRGKLGDILCVIVYSSEKQCYIHANHIENARPIPYLQCGRSGMAVINYGVYFGGVRVLEMPNNEEGHIPAIYYFNVSNSRKQCLCFDFILVNIAGRNVQPPKVVQAGPFQVYAVTRYAQLPTILWLVEVELQPDGTPTGAYKKVPCGVMPSAFYQKLFPSAAEALQPYECTSTDGRIAFKVLSSRNSLVTYDIRTYEWRIFEFPCQYEQRDFHLFDGCYEPVLTSRP